MRRVVVLTALLAAASCASFDLVELPAREADIYPSAHAREGVAVAVEGILDPRRIERYFGADLLHQGILPVEVIVSNHGDARVRIRPSDVLLLDGERVVDPLPIEDVVKIPKERGVFITDATAARLDGLYKELGLRERVLARDETYRGVLFFDVGVRRKRDPFPTRFFRMTNLFPEPPLRLDVMLTDLDHGERLRFGPFGVDVEPHRGI